MNSKMNDFYMLAGAAMSMPQSNFKQTVDHLVSKQQQEQRERRLDQLENTRQALQVGKRKKLRL